MPPSDAEREAQIRKARDDSHYYSMSYPRPKDEEFWMRRLDEARAEIARIIAALREPSGDLIEALVPALRAASWPNAPQPMPPLAAISPAVGEAYQGKVCAVLRALADWLETGA